MSVRQPAGATMDELAEDVIRVPAAAVLLGVALRVADDDALAEALGELVAGFALALALPLALGETSAEAA